MKENNQEQKKDIMKGLFTPSQKEKMAFSPVVEESQAKELPKVEDIKKDKPKAKKEEVGTKKRTYNIPVEILDDMAKVVYMNRDLNNQTELLIQALRKYLSSKEVKALLEEYETLKK